MDGFMTSWIRRRLQTSRCLKKGLRSFSKSFLLLDIFQKEIEESGMIRISHHGERVFSSFAEKLYPVPGRVPSASHRFIKTLEDRGKVGVCGVLQLDHSFGF